MSGRRFFFGKSRISLEKDGGGGEHIFYVRLPGYSKETVVAMFTVHSTDNEWHPVSLGLALPLIRQDRRREVLRKVVLDSSSMGLLKEL